MEHWLAQLPELVGTQIREIVEQPPAEAFLKKSSRPPQSLTYAHEARRCVRSRSSPLYGPPVPRSHRFDLNPSHSARRHADIGRAG